jgi:hypothetical protein
MMAWVSYESDVAPRRQERVRRRYAPVVGELSSLGFRERMFLAEVMRPRPSMAATLALMALNREVLYRHQGLSFGAAYLLMGHETPATIALPMGLGVKFYTALQGDGLIVSSTFPSEAVTDEGAVKKFSANVTTAEGWREHAGRVAEATRGGGVLRRVETFADFVAVARLEERAVVAKFPQLAD